MFRAMKVLQKIQIFVTLSLSLTFIKTSQFTLEDFGSWFHVMKALKDLKQGKKTKETKSSNSGENFTKLFLPHKTGKLLIWETTNMST